MKKLAIITICYNDRIGLERTLASVLAQKVKGLEHIVIDGGSTDGGLEVIHQYADRLAYWVSEPDAGIYHAQNKGWRRATAPWVLFLNAGDQFDAPDVLERVFPRLDCTSADLLYGDLRLVDDKGADVVKEYPAHLTSAWLMKESLPHPSQFTRLTQLNELGGFDTRYRITADHELLARAYWQRRIRTEKLPLVVSRFDTGGISSDPRNQEQLRVERKEIQRRHAPRFWYAVYHLWTFLNRIIRR